MHLYIFHLGIRAFASWAYPDRQQDLGFQARGDSNIRSWDPATCWLSEPSSLWFALFKLCLSNLPPELLTGPCSEALEITLFISLSSPDLQCRAFWCRNKAAKLQTAPSQHVSRATKKEIGLAHLKTMGLDFDFEFLQRVICVWEHVLSLCIYRRSLHSKAS